jgi:hypothetical protein
MTFLNTLFSPQPTLADHEQRSRMLRWGWLAFVIGIAGLIGLSMVRGGANPSMIGWVLYVAGIVAIFYEPRYSLYLMAFFAFQGDIKLEYWYWYPFNKNFSSGESLFYLGNAFIFSPLELYMVLGVLSWAIRQFVNRKLKFRMGLLGWPILIFTVAMVSGFAYGISRGGNLNIGLWEVRPMFYLTLIYFLMVNTIEERKQINTLMWIVMASLIIEGINGNYYYFNVLKMDLTGHDRIMEHSSSIHHNTVYVFFLASWLHKSSWTKRYLLPLFIPFVGITYLANQRRSSFIALAFALILMGMALFRYKRKLFLNIAPFAIVFGLLYTVAFWNSNSTLALPVQAVKSAFVTEGESSDASSNEYRVIENINTSFTIHQEPLLGVGFGKKFYIIAPLPDISFFDWWEYITHNSIMWIWMKSGFYGFMAMTFMIASMIVVGTHVYERIPEGDYKAIAFTMVAYIVMHFLYAYVDMSWDIQNMLYIGLASGILASLERVMAKPVKQYPSRYRWQTPPEPEPVIAVET